jgi:mitochondrial fission protein ELM1
MSDLSPKLTLLGKLGGKKLIAAIMGVLGVIASTQLGLTEAQTKELIETITQLIGLFIGGQTIVDTFTKGATSSATATVDPAEMKRIELMMQTEKAREAQNNAEAKKAEAQRAAMEVLKGQANGAGLPLPDATQFLDPNSEAAIAAAQK